MPQRNELRDTQQMEPGSHIVQLKDWLDRRHWLLAFDRDGTLAPITDDPTESFVSELAVKSLRALAEQPDVHVAIVSARASHRLTSDFPASKLILAGNYGCEMMLPDGRHLIDPDAEQKQEELIKVRQFLSESILPEHNAILDDHFYSLCVHWHLTPTEYIDDLKNILASAALRTTTLTVRQLPTSYEFLPLPNFDKARALHKIEEVLQLQDRSQVFYLFVGDSPQDEPAFDWVMRRDGAAFSVGPRSRGSANFHLKTPEDTAILIHDLLTYRQMNFPPNGRHDQRQQRPMAP